jgi:hypothetical protein
MRPLVVVLEWLVLLPLWRAIFRPRALQGLFAAATALAWLVIIVLVATTGGGNDGGTNQAGDQTAEAQRVRLPYTFDDQGLRITVLEVVPTEGTPGTLVKDGYSLWTVRFRYENPSNEDWDTGFGCAGLTTFKLKTSQGNLYQPRYLGGTVCGRMPPQYTLDEADHLIFEIRQDEVPIELWGYAGESLSDAQLVYIFDMPVGTPTPTAPAGYLIGESATITPEYRDRPFTLTFLSWKESDIAVRGPYVTGHYTFTAQPGMKFVIVAFKFRNDWKSPQYTPSLEGTLVTDKGHEFPVWDPPAGILSDECNPRQATEEERQTLPGDAAAYQELVPEAESEAGALVFEMPADEAPVSASLKYVDLPLLLQ